MSLQTVIAQINKDLGVDTVLKGSQLRHRKIQRVTTGSLAFDLALGGGWPLNQWHELVGNEGDGKTVTALKTVAANQVLNKKYTAVWVAAETLPAEWAEQLGVDLDRLIIVDSCIMEDVYQAVINFLESREVDCIVIDSLPALIPTVEDEQLMEDITISLGARITAKFFRKGGKATKRSLTEAERPVLGIVINQWRDKIGVTYGDPRTTPGGKAKNFAFFTRTEIRRSEWIEVGTGKNKLRIGQRIAARVYKNKSAPGQRVGEFDFFFAPGGPVDVGSYDSLAEVVNLGLSHNVIERRGKFYYHNGERIADGREALIEKVRKDDELATLVQKEVLHGKLEPPRVVKVKKRAAK